VPRLNQENKHYGVFTNSDGKTREAFIAWDKVKKGWIIRDTVTGRALIPTAFEAVYKMVEAKVKFVLSGKCDKIEKVVEKTEVKELAQV
jgi:hypothetical protein